MAVCRVMARAYNLVMPYSKPTARFAVLSCGPNAVCGTNDHEEVEVRNAGGVLADAGGDLRRGPPPGTLTATLTEPLTETENSGSAYSTI